MRKAIAVLCGLCLVAAVAIVVVAAGSDREVAFTLGVTRGGPVAELQPGDEVCQGEIRIPDGDAEFDRVVVAAGATQRPGSELELTLRPAGGAALGRGRFDVGFVNVPAMPTHSVPVGRIDTREPFSVCLRNTGTKTVAVYGNGDLAARTSRATLNGKPTGTDLFVDFDRAQSRSALSLLGAIFDRAALWRASWVGGWAYFLLALVVVAGVPALLAAALRDVTRG